MSKKNICFFSGDITRSGGTERVGAVIANELEKDEELNISILSMWEERAESYFTLDENIERYTLYEKVSRGIWRYLGYVRRIRSFIKKNNVDVLIDIDGVLDMYSIPAVIGLKTKIVSWEQFNYYNNPYVSYRKLTRKMAAKWADAIVVITKEDEGYYKDNLKIKHTIEQIYNPIHQIKDNANYNLSSRQILTVGRLTEQKGYDMLVDVAEKVLKNNQDWNWLIIGDGEEKNDIVEKIKEKNLSDRISIVDKVSDIDEIYRDSSIYVMTSRYEGFGLVLTEAKAHKLPCVSFKCPAGPSEIIEDGVNGYLVDCFDTDQMADYIEELIKDGNKRKSFSEKSLSGTDRFELKNIAQKWKDLISEI